MERYDEKIIYSTVYLLQDVLSFLVNFFLYFPNPVKIVFHFLLHSKENHEFTPIYPSLKIERISSSFAYDFDQELLFEPHEIKDYPCEPHDTTVDITSVPHSFAPTKI